MGTKVQSKTCLLPVYCSMRDLNEDSSSYSPSLFYGDKLLMNGHYYNGYSPSATAEASSGCEKDVVKQTMLEHEATFKYQVYELHRLYRIQGNLMEETRRKELHRKQYAEGTSFSPGPSTSQSTIDDKQRWRVPSFPVESSFGERSKQADPFTLQNGGSLRDNEVLESRPTKVRRKVFDLQLPADEYVDSDESDDCRNEKISGRSAHFSERNCNIGAPSSFKLLQGDDDKNRLQEDTSRFKQSHNSNGLADLNEPLQMEETDVYDNVHSVVRSVSHGVNGSSSTSASAKSQFLGLSQECLFNAHRGNDKESQNSHSSRLGWISHILEAGHGKDGMRSVPCSSQSQKLTSVPQAFPKLHDKVHNSPSVSFFNSNKADLWREKTVYDLEISNSGYEDKEHLDSIASLHKPSALPVIPFSSVAKHWSQSASSLEIPSASGNPKSVSAQMYPCHNITGTLSKTAPSNYTNGMYAEAWLPSSNLKSDPAFGFEYPTRNGSYHGSSSRTKEVAVNTTTLSYDYLKYCDSKGVSRHATTLDLEKYSKSSNFTEMKSANYFNTGGVISNGSSSKLVPEQGPAFLDRDKKHEEPLAALPWLRSKASCNNSSACSGVSTAGELSQFQSPMFKKANARCFLNETSMHKMTSVSGSSDFGGRKGETRDCSSNKKILGFPIFEKPFNSKNESSSLTSMSARNPSEDEVVENRVKIRMLDINLPYDLTVSDIENQNVRETPIQDMELANKHAQFRCQIDLNKSMTEEETSIEPSPSTKLKTRAVIDLESLPVPDTDEDVVQEEKEVETPAVSALSPQLNVKNAQDDLMMKAAEAIVAISATLCYNDLDVDSNANGNLSETLVKEPLTWFADIVSSGVDHLEKMLDGSFGGKYDESDEASSCEAIDIFESMTLRQMETREEDYMPGPLVPENVNLEESGPSSLPTRPRRGPARRGRQRRDFQRDTLPGLVSLSRHEVTEDLQTFGGIMRATGHPWHLLTRRNSTRGGGRGRMRKAASPSPQAGIDIPSIPAMQQVNVEFGLEDRNMTGWGKTPRRPRRQRFPAGSHQ